MAGSGASTAALLRMLKPWLTRVRDHACIRLRTLPETRDLSRDLWIRWHVTRDGSLAVQDVEAMELLELLARVDYTEAWTTILELCGYPMCLDQVLALHEPLYPRFLIAQLEFAFLASTFKPIATSLMFATAESTDHHHSPRFYDVRNALLESYVARHGRAFQRYRSDRIPLLIDLELTPLGGGHTVEQMLTDVATLAAIAQDPWRLEFQPPWHRERTAQSLVLRENKVFRIASVDVGFNTVSATDAMLLSTQTICSTWGLPIKALRFSCAQVGPGQLSPLVTTAFFRTMLVQEQHQEEQGAQPLARLPTELDLHKRIDNGVFQAACSALLRNQSVRHLSLEPAEVDDDQDHRLFWSWAAYALFSSDAANRIQHLELNLCGFTRTFCEAFKCVVQANDPLVCLPSRANGPYHPPSSERMARTPTVMEIRPRTTLLVAQDQLTGVETGDRVETLRVVGSSSDGSYVSVVYPGAGVCWVANTRVITRRPVVLQPGRRDIQQLDVEIDFATSLSGLVWLLKLVGSELRTLCIHAMHEVVLSETFMMELLAACPEIRRLELARVQITNFEWLVGSNGNASRLTSLVLRHVTTREADGYQRLFTTLPMQVVELSIQGRLRGLEQLSAKILDLLDTNQVLERLLLSVTSVDLGAISESLAEQLTRRHGKPLHVQKAPLLIRCKLALLSVVQQRGPLERDQEPEAKRVRRRRTLPELDAALVAAIFRYAAPPKHRVCGFL